MLLRVNDSACGMPEEMDINWMVESADCWLYSGALTVSVDRFTVLAVVVGDGAGQSVGGELPRAARSDEVE